MARIAFLIKQPKRALGALAVLVAATGVVVGSGANFSASTANPTNSFSACTLSMVSRWSQRRASRSVSEPMALPTSSPLAKGPGVLHVHFAHGERPHVFWVSPGPDPIKVLSKRRVDGSLEVLIASYLSARDQRRVALPLQY